MAEKVLLNKVNDKVNLIDYFIELTQNRNFNYLQQNTVSSFAVGCFIIILRRQQSIYCFNIHSQTQIGSIGQIWSFFRNPIRFYVPGIVTLKYRTGNHDGFAGSFYLYAQSIHLRCYRNLIISAWCCNFLYRVVFSDTQISFGSTDLVECWFRLGECHVICISLYTLAKIRFN